MPPMPEPISTRFVSRRFVTGAWILNRLDGAATPNWQNRSSLASLRSIQRVGIEAFRSPAIGSRSRRRR